jgi:hypothetical protein
MDGSANGVVAAHSQSSGRFTAGNSEYRAKLGRLADRLTRLQAEYEASPLLPIIARHLDDAERARTAVSRTRVSNAAVRLLATLKRRPEVLPSTLKEALDR